MNCKFCNAEIDETHKFCPFCGKDLTAEQETVDTEQSVEMPCDPQVQTEEQIILEEKPKKKVWPWVVGIAGAVIGLAALAVVLLIALGVDFKSFLPRANDILAKDAYCVADDKATSKGDTVIATMGGKELTNAQLQIYYRMQVMDFLNYYGNYASQIGMDYTKPLSEQTCYFDETMTWEQYLLQVAIDTWQNYQSVALLAEETGFTMGQEWQDSLDKLPEDLKTQAEEGEYESVEALLQDVIAPTCTEEIYMENARLFYLSNSYYLSMEDKLKPTQEDVETYFKENETVFSESGITKESGNIADVRHILLIPEGGTTDETTGLTTYTDDAWAACLKEAEKLLNDWKAGEATEESFAKLANEHSEDGGSNTSGGLYENIAPGDNYMESFLNWSVDMTRQAGDTGIVKTDYGYHIMYYIAGEPHWFTEASTQLLAERITEMTDAAEQKWPMEVNYRKIALAELKIA